MAVTRRAMVWCLTGFVVCVLLLHYNIQLVITFMASKPSTTTPSPINDVREEQRSTLDHRFYVPPMRTRGHIAEWMNNQSSFTIGAEIGVQSGSFAKWMMTKWTKCRKYYLIDIWAPLVNYGGQEGNWTAEKQLNVMITAKHHLKPWQNKTVFMKGRSDEIVHKFANESLDFVYIDARHDYCAVKQDLVLWWPKVRQGGILAGHDYMSDEEVVYDYWTLCEDGHYETGAVLRAVNEFASERDLQIGVTYRESTSNSYIIRKAYGSL